MIKTIFFDFGGVIIKQPSDRWVGLWKKVLGTDDHPEIADMLENPHESQMIKDICLGKIPEDTMWRIMAEKWHFRPSMIGFFRRWLFSKRQLNQHMVKFLGELNGHYQTAILSNAGDQSRRLMEEIYRLGEYVDEIIISAEEGVIKPDPRIFEIAMDRMRTKPETSLLLDDHLANVEAARAFGMHAVQFIYHYQAIKMVRGHLDGRYA